MIPFEPMKSIGGYRLRSRLGGRGSRVWLTEDEQSGKEYALRFFSRVEEVRESLEQAEHIRKEAEALIKLVHPNIARVQSFHIDEGGLPEGTAAVVYAGRVAYIVVDYIPNGTLLQRHRKLHEDHKDDTLSLSTVIRYVNDIAAGLQYAHNHDVVHGDLQPKHLVFAQNDMVVITDFPLPKMDMIEQAVQPDGIGDSPYQAPEQVKGGVCLKASDQFALATLAYEWLTGKLPFPQGDFSKDPKPLHELNAETPMAVEEVILRGLSRDPEDRYPSINTFARQLEAAQQGKTFTAEEWLQKAQATAQEGDYENARWYYDRALEGAPFLFEAHLGKGEALYQLKRYEDALLAYNKAITEALHKGFQRKSPSSVDLARVYLGQGNALLHLGRPTEAFQSYTEALGMYPRLAEAQVGQGDALWRQRKPAKERDTRLKQALAAYEAATKLSHDPDVLAAAYYGQGNIYYAREEYQQALEAYEKAIASSPTFAEAYCREGHVLRKLKQRGEKQHGVPITAQVIEQTYTRAIQAASEASPHTPFVAPHIYNSRGDFYSEQRHYEQAKADFGQASRCSPVSAGDYCARGYALLRLEDPQEALEAYKQAKRLAADEPEAYKGMGDAHFALENYSLAEESYETAISLDPHFAEAHCGLGNVCRVLARAPRFQGDRAIYWRQARNSYQQAIALDSYLVDGYVGKGDVLSDLGEYEEARQNFQAARVHYEDARNSYEAALQRDPENIAALNGKGRVLFKLNHFDDAIHAHAQVITSLEGEDLGLAPHLRYALVRAYYNKADVLHTQGRQARGQRGRRYFLEALDDLEQALELIENAGDSFVRKHKDLLADVYNGKGNAQVGLKAYHKALLDYERALRLAPSAKLYTNRGHALIYVSKVFKKRRLEEAQLAFELALSLDPKYIDAHLHMGMRWEAAYFWPWEREHLRNALRHYSRIVDSIAPRHLGTWRRKARVLRRLWKLREAEEAEKRVRELEEQARSDDPSSSASA